MNILRENYRLASGAAYKELNVTIINVCADYDLSGTADIADVKAIMSAVLNA